MQKRHNPLPSSLVITVVSLVVALLIFKPSSVFAEIDTGAALKSLCNELEKDTKLFQVDFEMAKCTCVQMPDACKELETLPYNFDTTCNKLLDQLLPETFKGLVTCSCAMFDNACQWFKKANDDSSGKSSVSPTTSPAVSTAPAITDATQPSATKIKTATTTQKPAITTAKTTPMTPKPTDETLTTTTTTSKTQTQKVSNSSSDKRNLLGGGMLFLCLLITQSILLFCY